MNKQEERALVKETKALIKQVESGDTAHAAWVAIQDRVRQLYEGRTQREVAEQIGKKKSWVGELLTWDFQDPGKPTPWAGPRGTTREASTATKILRDPQTRAKVLAKLDDKDLAAIGAATHDRIMERIRAKRSEHSSGLTVRELTGGGKFDPDESWADALITRIGVNGRKLKAHVAKWGLVIGSMSDEDALDYLESAERAIAEVRAAVQERIRDEVRA